MIPLAGLEPMFLSQNSKLRQKRKPFLLSRATAESACQHRFAVPAATGKTRRGLFVSLRRAAKRFSAAALGAFHFVLALKADELLGTFRRNGSYPNSFTVWTSNGHGFARLKGAGFRLGLNASQFHELLRSLDLVSSRGRARQKYSDRQSESHTCAEDRCANCLHSYSFRFVLSLLFVRRSKPLVFAPKSFD
jgi:hypothetical protein